ncbi:MAG: sigma-70 family RNA polymerase sigma factor [Methylocapsa sp.]|nr:sigma-70 family RNA polymerase sigma factor [Methylocapsa sp.]
MKAVAGGATAGGKTAQSTSPEDQWALLLRAANSGDAAAYRSLLLKLTPVLRAFARRGLARAGLSGADAEDIVQETLLAIHLKRQSWDESAPVGPWIRVIAHHKIIDALRRRGRRLHLPLDDFTGSLASGDEEPDRFIGTVDQHLEGLAPGQRKILHAIAVEGKSIAEAAAEFAMKPGAVRVALHRGLNALAMKLNAEGR